MEVKKGTPVISPGKVWYGVLVYVSNELTAGFRDQILPIWGALLSTPEQLKTLPRIHTLARSCNSVLFPASQRYAR